VPPADTSLGNLSQRVEFLEDRIMDSLEIVKDNQQKMGEDISKIKEAMYNPDAGIYARLKIMEERRKYSSKLVWFLFTVLGGASVATISSFIQ